MYNAGTMATTLITVLTELKKAIGDRPDDSDEQWMSDTDYRQFIYKHFQGDESTYTFAKRRGTSSVNVWTYELDNRSVMLFGMSFTEASGADYNAFCTGSIEETTSTLVDTSTSITVTATAVNFAELVVDVCQYLITHKAQKGSVNVGSVGYAPMDEQRLINIMETWRGIVAI